MLGKMIRSLAFVAVSACCLGFVPPKDVKYKCLVQLTNYNGEGAYVVVSLIAPSGKYERTLTVFGDEEKWYDDLTSWWKYVLSAKPKLDGLSGASITAGGRKIATFAFDDSKLNKGYKLRFETAVENGKYWEKDLEIELTTTNMSSNISGKGYIRYVKLIKVGS